VSKTFLIAIATVVSTYVGAITFVAWKYEDLNDKLNYALGECWAVNKFLKPRRTK